MRGCSVLRSVVPWFCCVSVMCCVRVVCACRVGVCVVCVVCVVCGDVWWVCVLLLFVGVW